MLDKILEWGQGGADHNYQNIVSCWGGDIGWVQLSTLVNLAQSVAFLVFSIQMLRAARLMHTKEQKTTIYLLVTVFAFWAMGGYLWDAIRFYFPLYRFHTIFVATIAVLSWLLVLAELRTSSILRYFQKMETNIVTHTNVMEQIDEYRLAIKAKNEPTDQAAP